LAFLVLNKIVNVEIWLLSLDEVIGLLIELQVLYFVILIILGLFIFINLTNSINLL